MSQQPTPIMPPSQPLQAPSRPLPPPSRPPRFVKARRWLRGRTGRVVVPVVALLLGIMLGVVSLLLYGLSGEGTVVVAPASGKGDIVVEADRAFLTNLVRANLLKSGMPGTIENVNVELATGDQMTITGDDLFSVLGIGVTKHFQLVVQLFITSCVLQIHVVHADLSGIPVTGFVQAFESQINQQLTQKPSNLPKGFKYCATGLRTEPGALFVTYSAVPLSMDGEVRYA